MFGLGIWEIALILLVALLVLGPEKLPKIARQVGRGMRELRRVAADFQAGLNNEVDEIDRDTRFRDELSDDMRKIAATLPKDDAAKAPVAPRDVADAPESAVARGEDGPAASGAAAAPPDTPAAATPAEATPAAATPADEDREPPA